MRISLRMCQLFYVFLCLFCTNSVSRIHKLKLNHHHNHPISYISQSPSPPPDSADPPSNDDETDDGIDGVFDVKEFGAVGDGEADDTDAFKSAWDAACSFESFDQYNNTATILVPQTHTFMIQSAIFTGPCQTDLIFQVDGTIVPPDGPKLWPLKNSKRQWLVFYRVDGLTLQGGGVIDGRGRKWWELPCKPHKGVNGTTAAGPCDSPVALRFFKSSDLTVTGLKIKNSPQFHFRFDECNGVHIENIVIKSPALSPNTDGIHIENTNSVEIYNSVISNGDDCVSIGSGCYDVDIKNITCGPSHGISIGSLGNRNSRACVSNITVRDTTIKTSDNGVRIKTWQGGYGSVSDIKFNNILIENVRNPIIIDQFYCATKYCTNQTSAILISDITYSNIKGTYDVRSPPIRFMCSDSIPCVNLTLTEVELLPFKGDMVLDPYCWNAYGGGIDTVTIPPISCLMDGVPPSIVDDENDYC